MLPATYGLNLFLYREEEEETILILKRKKIVQPQLHKAFFLQQRTQMDCVTPIDCVTAIS